MTAATAATTATEFAAERRKLADRVERATSWAALRESLDALTPTLRSTRGRVVRHTRAPKAATAERPAPAAKAEPTPTPATSQGPRPLDAAPVSGRESGATVSRPDAAPAKEAIPRHSAAETTVPRRPVRCPGTFRVVVLGLLLSLWWSTGETYRTARRSLRRRWRDATRPFRWALSDMAARVGVAARRVLSTFRRSE